MSEETYSQEQLEDFIKEFQPLKQETLIKYEEVNRGRLAKAPRDIQEAFNKKWKKTIGNSYYQPVTASKTVETEGRTDPKSNNYKINGKEGFWEVIFAPKSNPSDPDDVTLTVNGECLQIKRSAHVIVPGRFLECADHGTYPVYKQEPGVPRKIVSNIMFFPYTAVRIATEEEYRNMRREGDRIEREKREQEERI